MQVKETEVGVVKTLYRYPVKSMRGEEIEASQLKLSNVISPVFWGSILSSNIRDSLLVKCLKIYIKYFFTYFYAMAS